MQGNIFKKKLCTDRFYGTSYNIIAHSHYSSLTTTATKFTAGTPFYNLEVTVNDNHQPLVDTRSHIKRGYVEYSCLNNEGGSIQCMQLQQMGTSQ